MPRKKVKKLKAKEAKRISLMKPGFALKMRNVAMKTPTVAMKTPTVAMKNIVAKKTAHK